MRKGLVSNQMFEIHLVATTLNRFRFEFNKLIQLTFVVLQYNICLN